MDLALAVALPLRDGCGAWGVETGAGELLGMARCFLTQSFSTLEACPYGRGQPYLKSKVPAPRNNRTALLLDLKKRVPGLVHKNWVELELGSELLARLCLLQSPVHPAAHAPRVVRQVGR